ncbi:MAG: RNA-binding S4 domain-containing protein [Hyphomicrobiaceae bacterium]
MALDDEQHKSVLGSGQRLDKWLWFARVVKSRTLAAGLVTSGKVRVNRQKIDKPAHAVKIGDVVTVSVGRKVRILKVVASGIRRGPASEAQGLFEELTPNSASPNPDMQRTDAAGSARAPSLVPQAERGAGTGRPTKRDRRLIDHLRGRR